MPRRPAKMLARRWLVFAASVVVAAAPVMVRAEDGVKDASTIKKTQQNLNFQLPPDWPIERRGGIVGPIPVEEYLAMKFKALDGRLQTMEQKVNGMDLRLRVLEEALKKSASGLKSSESPAP